MLNLAHLEARRRGWPVDEPADVRTAIGLHASLRVKHRLDTAVFEHVGKLRTYFLFVYYHTPSFRHMWNVVVTSERADALE